MAAESAFCFSVLRDALIAIEGGATKTLKIDGSEMSEDDVEKILMAFDNKNDLELQVLHLNECIVSYEGSRALLRMLKRNTTIIDLRICDNRVMNKSYVDNFWCKEFAKVFEDNSTLKYVSLEVRQLYKDGMEALAAMLKDNKKIKGFYVKGDVSDSTPFAQALKTNTTLEEFRFDYLYKDHYCRNRERINAICQRNRDINSKLSKLFGVSVYTFLATVGAAAYRAPRPPASIGDIPQNLEKKKCSLAMLGSNGPNFRHLFLTMIASFAGVRHKSSVECWVSAQLEIWHRKEEAAEAIRQVKHDLQEEKFKSMGALAPGGLHGACMRGACFSGEGKVAVGRNGKEFRYACKLRAGDEVYSPSLQQTVKIAATVKGKRARGKSLFKVEGLLLTSLHPIKKNNADISYSSQFWQYPRDIGEEIILEEDTFIYNFVVSEGGTMCVNNLTTLTLGDNEGAGYFPIDKYWGTNEGIVEDLRSAPGWPNVLYS